MKMQLFHLLLAGCILFSSAPLLAANQGGPFALCVTSYDDASKYKIMKYNVVTGETWVKGPNGFTPIPESQKIQESNYRIEITEIHEGWFATRIDTHTGKIWTIQEGKWVEYL